MINIEYNSINISSASSRNSLKMKSPDRMVSSCHTDTMVSSCHGLLSGDHESNLMTQSLDPNMLTGTFNNKTTNNNLQDMEGKIMIQSNNKI